MTTHIDNTINNTNIDNFLRVHGNFNSNKTKAFVSIFNTPAETIQTFCEPNKDIKGLSEQVNLQPETLLSETAHIPSYNGLKCHRCNIVFDTWDDQKLHFKSDLHLSKLTNRPIVSISDNQSTPGKELSSETAEVDVDDVNSDSNDSSSDDEIVNSKVSPNTEFYNSIGSIRYVYSANRGSEFQFSPSGSKHTLTVSSVVLPKEFPSMLAMKSTANECWNLLYQSISFNHESNPVWCVFIFKSGKFAGGVFDSTGSCLIHKVFRRYTVRAKAGGSQSSHDGKNGKAKSAGAMMRRQGEQAIKDDIQQLLRDWHEYILASSLILMSVSKNKRTIFFQDESISSNSSTSTNNFLLSKDDIRVRWIPFGIPNPTFEAVTQAFKICSTLVFALSTVEDIPSSSFEVEQESIGIKTSPKSEKEQELNSKSLSNNVDSRTTEVIPITSIDNPIANKLFDACNSRDTNLFKSVLDNVDKSDVYELLKIPNNNEEWLTLLHYASMLGLVDIVMILLRCGADPCTKDIRGRLPYHLAKDKETRDAFRRYRGEYETKLAEYNELIIDAEDKALSMNFPFEIIDWLNSGVDSAITNELEKLRKEKEREKKKRQKENKKLSKEREAETLKSIQEMQLKAKIELERKEAEEIELLKKILGNCYICQTSLYKHELYEVFDKKVCSNQCVLIVRRKLAAEAAEKRFGR